MQIQPKSATVKGPANFFSGDVWIDAIAQGQGASPANLASVHFAPGARTAWHSHSIGQALYVTEGEGRVQSRGAEVVVIRPGDIVHTPGNEWHWHGASRDRFMVHLSLAEGDAEWGEHVTDAEYDVGTG